MNGKKTPVGLALVLLVFASLSLPALLAAQSGDPILQAVPFLRYVKLNSTRQHWTTDPDEKGNRPQWQFRAIEGNMSMYPTLGSSMPFYRFVDPLNGNYFWTTNPAEMDEACSRCVNQGRVGYLMATAEHPDLVPLHRCYNPTIGKHFWSIQKWRCENHGDYEGIVGHVFANTQDVAFQTFWRGGSGLDRDAPVVADVPDWNAASAWGGPVLASDLPGSGNMQAVANYILSGVLYQDFWRGNQGWSRTVPVQEGEILWSQASGFTGPYDIADLPGTGNMQATSNYVLDDTLYQTFWRGGQGYARSIPIHGDVVSWGDATDWDGPYGLSGLPGSGTVQGQANYVFGDILYQDFWRGGEGYSRTVPIVDGAVDWANASDWSGPVLVGDLPGSGTMQGVSVYSIPRRVGLF